MNITPLLLTDADVFAGTERHMLALALGLAEIGVAPKIGSPGAGPLASAAAEGGIEHVAIEKNGRLDHRAIRQLTATLRSERVNLVHAHNGRTAMIGAAACRLAGRGELVLTQHFISPARTGRAWPARVMGGAVHRWVGRRAGRIIAVSEAVRQGMIERGDAEPEQVVTIPNGISPPPPLSESEREATREGLGVRAEQPLVVCLARLEPEKGLETLIGAMAEVASSHPDACCVIAGRGRQEPELRRRIEEHGLAERVRLLGFRRDSEKLLGTADVVALPSKAEPFGLVLVEAMALRRAVIAVDSGGPREIVAPVQTGLLTPVDDAHAMAAAIGELLAQPERRRAMGEAGHERYQKYFTARTMAQRTRAVYAQVLGVTDPTSGDESDASVATTESRAV